MWVPGTSNLTCCPGQDGMQGIFCSKARHSFIYIYSVSGLSCPEEEAYLTVIFHSYLHNNNINSDYILGANIYFTPHSIFSSYF